MAFNRVFSLQNGIYLLMHCIALWIMIHEHARWNEREREREERVYSVWFHFGFKFSNGYRMMMPQLTPCERVSRSVSKSSSLLCCRSIHVVYATILSRFISFWIFHCRTHHCTTEQMKKAIVVGNMIWGRDTKKKAFELPNNFVIL